MGWLEWSLLVLGFLAHAAVVCGALAPNEGNAYWLEPEFTEHLATESVVEKIERWQSREIRAARAATCCSLLAVAAGLVATAASWPVDDWRQAALLLTWPLAAFMLIATREGVREEGPGVGTYVGSVIAALLICLYFAIPGWWVEMPGPHSGGRVSTPTSVAPSDAPPAPSKGDDSVGQPPASPDSPGPDEDSEDARPPEEPATDPFFFG